jgi:hypothetical protein
VILISTLSPHPPTHLFYGKLRDRRRVEDPPAETGPGQRTVPLPPRSIITNSAWSRKYLGLYDFETQESTRRKLRVEGNAVVMKEGEKLILVDEHLEKLTKGRAEVLPTHPAPAHVGLQTHPQRQLLPARPHRLRGEGRTRPAPPLAGRQVPPPPRTPPRTQLYTLREKDVIKLGKQKLKVREVVPADLSASAIIPGKGDIKLTKTVYDHLALKETLSEPEEKQREEREHGK